MLILVPLARLRFVFILGAIAALIMNWDYLAAKYEHLTRSKDAEAAAADSEYFCPMHPAIVRDSNKEKCPICFMPLSRRKKGDRTAEELPAGIVSRVQLSPYRIVLAGVRTVPATYQALQKEIVTIGTVEFDERNLKNVASRIKGRIEKLLVNQTGQLVAKDEALAEIYSPDLIVTVENLQSAVKEKNANLETNARDRLRRWNIDDKEIERILAEQQRTGQPVRNLTIRAPIGGHVLKKYVLEGQYVDEGTPLYEVVDLSSVWAQAQLYEEDLAFLPADTHDPTTGLATRKIEIAATTRAFPGRIFEGTLSFVYPHLDPDSRTLAVRFTLQNQSHELRPGMTMAVRMNLDTKTIAGLPAGKGWRLEDGKVLCVPESSVIDTGEGKIVYREELPGTYEGVEVKLGPRMSDPQKAPFYPVLHGLNENDLVVASGSFLIDAETRLNPAVGSTYMGSSGGGAGKPAAARPAPRLPKTSTRRLPPP